MYNKEYKCYYYFIKTVHRLLFNNIYLSLALMCERCTDKNETHNKMVIIKLNYVIFYIVIMVKNEGIYII